MLKIDFMLGIAVGAMGACLITCPKIASAAKDAKVKALKAVSKKCDECKQAADKAAQEMQQRNDCAQPQNSNCNYENATDCSPM